MPAPTQRIRWLNDGDLGVDLHYVGCSPVVGKASVLLQFETPLLEKIQKEAPVTSAEYAYIYNNVANGNKTFMYRKNSKGWREVVSDA